jgi:hypothetical protein
MPPPRRKAPCARSPEDDVVARARRERAQAFLARGAGGRSVNHPNICQIYEIGEDDGVLFIAMELARGHTAVRAAQGAPLGVRTVSTGLGILNALVGAPRSAA